MQTTKLYNNKATLYFDEANHVYSLDEKQEKIIPGVTSITSMVAKPALVQWAVNCAMDSMLGNQRFWFSEKAGVLEALMDKHLDDARYAHRKISAESAVNGTKAHKWIENYIKGEKQTQPENPEIMGSCFAFLNWLREAKPEFIYTERPILSQKHGYAGTLDFTAKFFEDIQVGTGLTPTYFPPERSKKEGMLILGDFKTSKAIYPEYFMETAARVKALEEEFPEVKYDAMMIVRVGKDGKYETKVETDIDKYFKAFLGAKQLYMTFKA